LEEVPVLNPSPEYVLREFYAAFAAGDIERALDYCDRDIAYIKNRPRFVVPFGDETHGRNAMRATMGSIWAHFIVRLFTPGGIGMVGNLARAQVRFHYRHRVSGHEFEGTLRHEVVIEHAQITCIREYQDTERIHAFMQLVRAPADSRTALLT
jgi:ketosteroid isomerase-like protein